MTPQFLIFCNLVLVLRLGLLLGDSAQNAGGWIRKGLIELLGCALFGWNAVTGMLVAVTVLANVAGAGAARFPARREAWQLGIGLLHLGVLSVCFSPAMNPGFGPAVHALGQGLKAGSAFGAVLARGFSLRPQAALFGLLLSANEANLLLRAIFERLQLRPRLRPASAEIDTGEYNRGRVIGLLERMLIFFFVLNGQFGAIGFTLAAKGFTRFKELEDRGFAEYVLIGTLLSSALAMTIGVFVKHLM